MLDYDCKLYRLSGGSALRSSIIEGWCGSPPEEGKMFLMRGMPLDESGDIRLVNTSKVVEIEETEPGTYVFVTYSGSKYCAELKRRDNES